MEVQHGQKYTPIFFGDAALSVLSFIGSNGHMLVIVLCALCRPHFSSNSFFKRFCMFLFYVGLPPNDPPFIGLDEQKALLFYGMTL